MLPGLKLWMNEWIDGVVLCRCLQQRAPRADVARVHSASTRSVNATSVSQRSLLYCRFLQCASKTFWNSVNIRWTYEISVESLDLITGLADRRPRRAGPRNLENRFSQTGRAKPMQAIRLEFKISNTEIRPKVSCEIWAWRPQVYRPHGVQKRLYVLYWTLAAPRRVQNTTARLVLPQAAGPSNMSASSAVLAAGELNTNCACSLACQWLKSRQLIRSDNAPDKSQVT